MLRPARSAALPLASRPRETAGEKAYGRSFWFAYAANTALMVSVSLLFRYADFVEVLGGGELALGLIVGVGTIGSLAMRLAQGVAIDRYGSRSIWLGSLAVIFLMLLAHLAIRRVDAPWVYLVRIAYDCGVAGAFGASLTYISLKAPAARMAEMIGMLGSSGFVGMALGTQLGDALCAAPDLQRFHIDRLFWAAAAIIAFSALCTWIATRDAVRPVARRRRPPMAWLLRRYHPGPMLIMAMAMGMGLTLPQTFLRPYAESLGLARIGAFFAIYAVTAFTMRVALRRLPDRIGSRRAALLGMIALIAAMMLYLVVDAPWTLVFPGTVAGLAHALLFPAVMAGGNSTFPARHRGLATTLVLGLFDVGKLLGMPLAGGVIDAAAYAGLPPYPTMFLTMAALLTLAAVVYLLWKPGGRVDSRVGECGKGGGGDSQH